MTEYPSYEILVTMDDQTETNSKSRDSKNPQLLIGSFWVISVLIALFFGYLMGNVSDNASPESNQQPISNVLSMHDTPADISKTQSPEPTPLIINKNICSKSGFSQKWEYLVGYEIKENDSVSEIAKTELNDSSRVNEIMQINGMNQLVVGSTLYLPPASVAKSSGNIREVSGRLIAKDTNSWQISFNGAEDGQAVIIPSFWFADINDKDTHAVGDCLTVLFDDGYKVFSVKKQ